MSLHNFFAADLPHPEKFDVVALTNLNGISADALAAQVADWYCARSQYYLRRPLFIFEATHDYARYSGSKQGYSSSLLLSGNMPLIAIAGQRPSASWTIHEKAL